MLFTLAQKLKVKGFQNLKYKFQNSYLVWMRSHLQAVKQNIQKMVVNK